MSQALLAFRAVDFNWTHDLQSVWKDSPFQVEELHRPAIDGIIVDFLAGTRGQTANPIGRVVLGEAGAGKTHLVGTLRHRVWREGGWFVLIDIIGITDFWATAALGFVNSLHQPMPATGLTQYQAVLNTIASQVPLNEAMRTEIAAWMDRPVKTKLDEVELFLKLLASVDPMGTRQHQDVIRAVLLLDAADWDAANLAYCWLQGLDVDEGQRRQLKFLAAPPPHHELVRGMLWVMGLAGPTLIAVDQIDSIVSASNILVGAGSAPVDDGEKKARHIIETLAGGLMDLHDLKRRAMTVVSCLEVTWPIIEKTAVRSAAQRFERIPVLSPIRRRETIEALIRGRLESAYGEAGFRPPYPTWPFRSEAIESAIGLLPRQILMRCQEHRQRCVAAGEVIECASLVDSIAVVVSMTPADSLDRAFREALARADLSFVLDVASEDTVGCALLLRVSELFLRQFRLPDSIDAIVQPDPDRKKPSLHSRVSFTFHDKGDQEEHYCFRILGQSNAIAFQSRLKAAMTASGIDRALKFRQLFILRRGDPPGGQRSRALVDQFVAAGGRFIAPTDEDWRTFVALAAMAERDVAGFDEWLYERKPLCDTSIFKAAGLCPPPFLAEAQHAAPREAAPTGAAKAGAPLAPAGPPTSSQVGPGSSAGVSQGAPRRDGAHSPALQAPIAAVGPSPSAAQQIPIGRRLEHGTLGPLVTLATDLLPRHTAILAGSGSGKTVLLRRMVEEAALLGIPAIVLDVNNDLARLGDAWPTPPESWSEDDRAKATAYHQRADVVIWTPGVAGGNPISLDLLPDFAAIRSTAGEQNDDDISQAVEMARATLAPYLSGTGQKAILKEGVLADALRVFAMGEAHTLEDLARLLSELPDEASKIGGAAKLAAEMANHLHAVVATNPLLHSADPKLDPGRLFQGPEDKTRVSVINLAGLGSDEARQSFVNQLQMALFAWIKRHPSPTGRIYVLDEAQNFAPSQAGTACKQSTRSLVAQARKYGLGMIFATQLPRGIDHAIVSNCTTQLYGRMSAPATIQATQELMAAKGGTADDIGRLKSGEFYFSTEGLTRPIKVKTPLCLSWHPANPPTAEEVIRKAALKKQ